jgi:hypothetical protein
MPDGQLWGDFTENGEVTALLSRNRNQERWLIERGMVCKVFAPGERIAGAPIYWEELVIPRAITETGVVVEVTAVAETLVPGAHNLRICVNNGQTNPFVDFFCIPSSNVADRTLTAWAQLLVKAGTVTGAVPQTQNSSATTKRMTFTGDLRITIFSEIPAANGQQFMGWSVKVMNAA